MYKRQVQHAPETPDRKTLLVWLPKPEWPESQRRELVASLQPLAEPFGLSLPDGHWDDVATRIGASAGNSIGRPILSVRGC